MAPCKALSKGGESYWHQQRKPWRPFTAVGVLRYPGAMCCPWCVGKVYQRHAIVTLNETGEVRDSWYLSRDERDRIDLALAQRLLDLKREPYVVVKDGSSELKNRSVFASVAYARAGEQAKRFSELFPSAQAKSLRHVTLRHSYQGGMLDTIRAMSATFNKTVSYCIRQKLAVPQLTTVHIRIRPDHTNDIHFHGLWSIEADNVAELKRTLELAFTPVWIEPDLVGSPKKACFYICARIMDHGMMEHWSDAKLAEVWDLPSRTRLIRPAGSFRSDESGPSIGPRPSPSGSNAEIQPMVQRLRCRVPIGVDVSTPTVRPSLPELPLDGPTLGHLGFVFYLLERFMEGPNSLERWCRASWRSYETALEAIRTVQGFADWEPLFTESQVPDGLWNITDEGRRVWTRYHQTVDAVFNMFP